MRKTLILWGANEGMVEKRSQNVYVTTSNFNFRTLITPFVWEVIQEGQYAETWREIRYHDAKSEVLVR